MPKDKYLPTECHECKKTFKTKSACLNHAKEKRHQWQDHKAPARPSPIPTAATLAKLSSVVPEAAPRKRSSFMTSILQPLQPSISGFPPLFTSPTISVPTTSASTAIYHPSPSYYPPPPQYCRVCSHPVSCIEQHYKESPKHPKCGACGWGFADEAELRKHRTSLSATLACNKCKVRLPFQCLESHYRASERHPSCDLCGLGFKGALELQEHSTRCSLEDLDSTAQIWADLATTEMKRAHDLQSRDTSAVHPRYATSSTPGTPGSVAAIPDSEPETWAWASGVGASKSNPISGASPTATVEDNASDTDSDIERGISPAALDSTQTAEDPNSSESTRTLLTPTSETANRSLPPLQDIASLALLSNGSDTDAVLRVQRILNMQSDEEIPPSAPQSISWHCRSCLKACHEPVATLCGHIFCRSCILRELSTNMACPVCKKPFLIGIDVMTN